MKNKNIQKTLQKEIKHAETKYTSKFLTDNIHVNPKKFYSFFKARKQDSTGISTLKHNNSLITLPAHKAHTLNFSQSSPKHNQTSRTCQHQRTQQSPLLQYTLKELSNS